MFYRARHRPPRFAGNILNEYLVGSTTTVTVTGVAATRKLGRRCGRVCRMRGVGSPHFEI